MGLWQRRVQSRPGEKRRKIESVTGGRRVVLSLRYGDLSGAATEANRLADELNQYCEDLSRKVQQKMYSVEGGMSSALSNADYYVNQKITQLRNREESARTLSEKARELHDTAKRVDEDVERMIEDNQESFFQKNPELKAPWYKQAWTSFMCDMKNVPVLGWLIQGGEDVMDAIDVLGKEIKHWWKCGGGKELIMNVLDIVIKIGEAVVAVLAAVTAVVALATATVITFGAVLVTVAAVITAVIASVNAVTNVFTSVQAISASRTGDPTMAKIYGERDTLAQVLRDHNFHDRELNRASYKAASAIEITDTIAGVINMVHSIGKIAGGFLSKNGVGFAFKELARGADGKPVKKVTLKSIWKGTKALILNEKLTSSTSAGLRTTLFTNIKQSFNYQKSLFKMALRDPKRWFQTRQTGDMGFFRNIMEKIRYNYSQFKNTAFQFRPGDLSYNLDKISNIASVANDGLGITKDILEGLDRTDNKGLARRALEKFTKDKLFGNDFFGLMNKTGLGGIIVDFDKSGYLKDFTGMGDGVIQKIQNIGKSAKLAAPPFGDFFPYFECVRGEEDAQ